MLPVVVRIGGDPSWRVRWSLAKALPTVCSALGEHITNASLCATFEALLADSEAEVQHSTLLYLPVLLLHLLCIILRLFAFSLCPSHSL